jgi:tetrahedral aminopeptidase
MTIDTATFLKQMISISGLSAYEDPIRQVIQEAWKPLVDELTVSKMGSLHGLRRGCGVEPRPRLLISAHMDAIGLMVTGIVDGFLRITEVGGVDQRILPGQWVTVHGKRDLPAVVVQPADRLLPPGQAGNPVKMSYLLVDTGLLPEETAKLVRVGDLVSFAQAPLDLAGAIAGHTMDNRASVAALTVCLQELQHIRHEWDIWAVASSQEEESLAGAFTSPFEIKPTIAIAVDVTFAKGPGANDFFTFPLDSGPAIAWGPDIHPALYKALKEVAETLDMPHNKDVMPRHSGTDAYGMQIVAEGIPTAVVSIPLRNMHTPVETVTVKDINRTGHLLAQFIAGLPVDFVSKIHWD